MPDYIYSIILVLIIVVIAAIWTTKKKNEEWQGVLVKKEYDMGDEDSSGTYKYEFKTDTGKKKKFTSPDQKYFDQWTIGDKAVKKKGEFFPKKA